MIRSDYTYGTITLTNGDDEFTGTGTLWMQAKIGEGDTIFDLPGTAYQAVIQEITGQGSGLLTKPWDGPTMTTLYRMRYQPDGSRMPAQAAQLIELLGNGNLLAFAGLAWSGGIEFPAFNGAGAMVLIPKTDLISGAEYDVQVSDLAARATYDAQATGYAVLVSDVGDGRSAIYSKVSDTSGDWSDPAYVTGPVGPVSTVPGITWQGTYNPATAYVTNDGVLDNGSSWRAKIGTVGNAPPVLPTTSNTQWELVARRGTDGAGTGDVVGPASAVVDRIATFDDTTGKLIKDSGLTILHVLARAKDFAHGRITLESSVPVSTTNQLAKTAIYWTPNGCGNTIGLYVGGSWVLRDFAETMLSVAGFAVGTYDVFAYDNAGTLALEALAWANDVTRATAIALQDGIKVKSGDPTRRLVGTIYIYATGLVQLNFGTAASGGGAAHIGIWNQYNRVVGAARVVDSDAAHSYLSSTVRGWAGGGTCRISMVRGADEDAVDVNMIALFTTAVDGSANIGLGLDTTTAFVGPRLQNYVVGGRIASSGTAVYKGLPGLGFHYVHGLEQGDGITTTGFQGTADYHLMTGTFLY